MLLDLKQPMRLATALALSPSNKAYCTCDRGKGTLGMLLIERLPLASYSVTSHLIYVFHKGHIVETLKCHNEREVARLLTYSIAGGRDLAEGEVWVPLETAYALLIPTYLASAIAMPAQGVSIAQYMDAQLTALRNALLACASPSVASAMPTTQPTKEAMEAMEAELATGEA